jgi:hypothetical protein
VVRHAEVAEAGDRLDIRVAEGRLTARVESERIDNNDTDEESERDE